MLKPERTNRNKRNERLITDLSWTEAKTPLQKRFPAHDIGHHFVPVPVSLLLFGGQLGLTDSQFRILVALLAFKGDERAPFPSEESLANYLAREPEEIRSLLTSLCETGFLQFVDVEHPNTGELVRGYNLDPLADALQEAVVRRAEQKRAMARQRRLQQTS